MYNIYHGLDTKDIIIQLIREYADDTQSTDKYIGRIAWQKS
jgi:hypothetical protein